MLTGLALAYAAFTLVFVAVFVVALMVILRSGRFSVISRRLHNLGRSRARRDPEAPGPCGGGQSA